MSIRDSGRELIVLGIVRRSPVSAYAVEQTVRRHIPLYRPFRHGNVYHLLERFGERGLVARAPAKARRGPREEKHLFRITPAGETYFSDLLKSVLLDVQASDPALEIALVLLGQIPRNEAAALLEARGAALAQQEQRLDRLYGGIEGRTGAASISAAHVVARVRAERDFVREALSHLRDQRWTPEWVLDDGPVDDEARRL